MGRPQDRAAPVTERNGIGDPGVGEGGGRGAARELDMVAHPAGTPGIDQMEVRCVLDLTRAHGCPGTAARGGKERGELVIPNGARDDHADPADKNISEGDVMRWLDRPSD